MRHIRTRILGLFTLKISIVAINIFFILRLPRVRVSVRRLLEIRFLIRRWMIL